LYGWEIGWCGNLKCNVQKNWGWLKRTVKLIHKISITLAAITLGIIHLVFPHINIDAVFLALILVGLLPWIAPIIKALEIPGLVKITFQEAKAATDKLSGNVIINVPTGEMTLTGQPPSLEIRPTEEDSSQYLRRIIETDPNLGLVAIRIEIEKRVRRIADFMGESSRKENLQKLVNILGDQNILNTDATQGIIELIILGNRAAHGASVEPGAAALILDTGLSLLRQLDQAMQGNSDPPL